MRCTAASPPLELNPFPTHAILPMTILCLPPPPPGIRYNQYLLRVKSAQLDDQLYGTAYPVALHPADLTPADHPAEDPLLHLIYSSEPGRRRNMLYCPCIAARLTRLRVAVNEPLLWRLWDLLQSFEFGGAKEGEEGNTQQQVLHESRSDNVLLLPQVPVIPCVCSGATWS